MTLLEAIKARHSVRKYIDSPIPDDILEILQNKVDEINEKVGLHIQLVTNEPKAFGGLRSRSGAMIYGRFSGVSSYFVMAGKKSKDLDEKVGYYGEQLVLLAQTLGLNTCWAGLSYSKIPGTYELNENEKIACYIALGYGQNQGATHKTKSVTEVSNIDETVPDWFRAGVDAALLAPTAVNQQKFFIEFGSKENESSLPEVTLKSSFSLVGYTQMDLGIVKLHFELGAGKDNFQWK